LIGQSFLELSALDLSGTKATGANVNGSVSSVYNCLYPADVGLPTSVGLAVRVRNVMSKGNALAANTALSHFNTSKIQSRRTSFYIFLFVNTNQQELL